MSRIQNLYIKKGQGMWARCLYLTFTLKCPGGGRIQVGKTDRLHILLIYLFIYLGGIYLTTDYWYIA
jgi:hypothetical protein